MSKLEAAYDLFRRLPPAQIETNLSFVSEMLNDDDADELLQTVDAPLKTREASSGTFLLSDYNRDGDSYRSPHDNKYYPPTQGVAPSAKLRQMEIGANKLFSIYAQQYYGTEGAVTSVYFWEVEGGFAACVLIHKDAGHLRDVERGIWDSIHVFSVEEKGRSAKYSLSTTILLNMKTGRNNLDLSGSVQKQMVRDNLPLRPGPNPHIINMGEMVQDMENKLRQDLQLIYFDKAREITRTLRETESASMKSNQKLLMGEMMAALVNRRR